MRDIILIVIVLAASLIAIRRPVFGILAFIAFGIINPQGMVWGVGRMIPLAMLTAIGTIVGYVLWTERKTWPLYRETVLLLMLWGTFVISTPFAIYPDRASDHLILTSKILLMTFLTMLIINTERRLHLLLKTIGLSLGALALKAGIFVLLTGGSEMVYGPEAGFLASNNSIGLALAINVPLLVYVLKRESHWQMQWLVKSMIVCSYPAVVCTFSRGAWIGLTAVTALLVMKGKRKFIMVTILSLLAILVVPLLPDRVTNRYDDLRNYQSEGSAQSRFWNWEFCKRVGVAHPLNGGGFDFYSLESYARYYPEFLEQWPGKVWSCHSSWLTILGEHGIPAFLLWLALMLSCLRSLAKLNAYGRGHPDFAWLAPFAMTVQTSMLGYMIVATFLDAAYFDVFYELIAAIVIAKSIVAHQAAQQHAQQAAARLREGLHLKAS